LLKLRAKVDLGNEQYGGIGGVSADHFIIETLDTIDKCLSEGKVASLTSIDFSKAFNRMDHDLCTKALALYGAERRDIQIVNNFLANRTMRVKRGLCYSSERKVFGGAPQGSILGPFLFSLTARLLEEDPELLKKLKRMSVAEVVVARVRCAQKKR
jgi:hypothetical protein